MTKRWILYILLVGVTSTSAFGQQSSPPSGESHKYRTILTLAGGGGGFAVGLFTGLAVFDDATNSDRKVWTTAILAGVGGAIGGYFLGRALDRRSKTANVTGKSDAFEQSLVRDQWPTPWMDETLKARQRLDRNSLPVSHLAANGSVNQAIDSAPSLDTNYLYLISALRRMQMAAD
jgi:hypothetical protein